MKFFTDKGFCDLEVDVHTLHGMYTWIETAMGHNASSECRFGPEDDIGVNVTAMVTRMCSGPHQWTDYYGGYCITEVTFRIRMLGNVRSTIA